MSTTTARSLDVLPTSAQVVQRPEPSPVPSLAGGQFALDPGAAAGAAATPTGVVAPHLVRSRSTDRQRISHHWEGVVVAIGNETFVATLRSLHSTSEVEQEAEIPLEEISEDDHELVTPGAVFYWTIGHGTSPGGTVRRFSQIKFRRLPTWNNRTLRRVDERARELFQMFGNAHAADQASDV